MIILYVFFFGQYEALIPTNTNTIEKQQHGIIAGVLCSTPATVHFFHGAKNEKLRIPDFCCCVWSNRKNQVRWNDSSGVSVIDKNVVMIQSLKAQLVQ